MPVCSFLLKFDVCVHVYVCTVCECGILTVLKFLPALHIVQRNSLWKAQRKGEVKERKTE